MTIANIKNKISRTTTILREIQLRIQKKKKYFPERINRSFYVTESNFSVRSGQGSGFTDKFARDINVVTLNHFDDS